MKIGVSASVSVVEREKFAKNDNWNFWIWFLLSKNGRFVAHISFSKNALLKPLFYSVFGRAFFGQVSKRDILDTHQKGKN